MVLPVQGLVQRNRKLCDVVVDPGDQGTPLPPPPPHPTPPYDEVWINYYDVPNAKLLFALASQVPGLWLCRLGEFSHSYLWGKPFCQLGFTSTQVWKKSQGHTNDIKVLELSRYCYCVTRIWFLRNSEFPDELGSGFLSNKNSVFIMDVLSPLLDA